MAWQVQDAKQRFSELVRRALDDGPQIVTRHGREVVVVLSAAEYRRLTQPAIPFERFLLDEGPDLTDLDLTRSTDPTREVEV
jgi:prevent-host-death family protein